MKITNEFINQLNKTIEVSIEHGGDAGGAYYCCKEEIFEEVNNLVKLIDEENKLEVVWNNEYKEQPIIRLAVSESKEVENEI